MATSNFNKKKSNNFSRSRNQGQNQGGIFGGGTSSNALMGLLGIFGFKQIQQYNKQTQRMQREAEKKQWHLSAQNYKNQKKIYDEQIKIFEDLSKAIGVSIDQFNSLDYNSLTKLANYLKIKPTGIDKEDVTTHLKRKGKKPSDITTFDDGLKEVNELMSSLGLQGYEMRDVPSTDIIANALIDPLKKLDFSILNPQVWQKSAIEQSTLQVIDTIGNLLSTDSTALKTFKDTGVIDNKIKGIIQPITTLLNQMGKSQDEIDSFMDHFLHQVEDLVSITNEEFEEIYEKLGGKTFLMSDTEKKKFEKDIKKFVSSGLTDVSSKTDITNTLKAIDKKEETEIDKIKKLIVANGNKFSESIFESLIEGLELSKRHTEKDINELRKFVSDMYKKTNRGEEMDDSQKAFLTKQRFSLINNLYQKASDKLTQFFESFGAMMIPIKVFLGWLGYTITQIFTNIEDISSITGRFSKTLWGEFDTLHDEVTAIFYNRDAFNYDSTQRILKTSQELFRTQYSLFSQLGRVYGETDAKTLNKVALWSDIVSMTGDEVGGILRTFRDISTNGLEDNLQLMTQIATFADSAGVNTKELFEEIGQNSNLYARNMGTSVKEMVKLNVQLMRVGLSMKDIDRVMSGFDTVEGTLEKSMKLSIFTGKNMNFMAMATAQMMGDLPRATEELRKQLNLFSDDEWYSAGFALKKMMIAKQLNMTEEELNKIRRGLSDAEKEAEIMTQKIDDSFTKTYTKFYENFRQIGLSKLKQYFDMYILVPMSQLVTDYKDEFKAIIDLLGWFMKNIGIFMLDAVRIFGAGAKWFLEFTGINKTINGERQSFELNNMGSQDTKEGKKEPKSKLHTALSVVGGIAALGATIWGASKLRQTVLGGNSEVYWLKKIYQRMGGGVSSLLGGKGKGIRGGLQKMGTWISNLFAKRIPEIITTSTGSRTVYRNSKGQFIKKGILGSNPLKVAKIGGGVLSAVALASTFWDTYQTAVEGALETTWSSRVSSLISGGTLGFMIGGPVGALVGAIVGVVGNEVTQSIGKVNTQMNKIMKDNPLLSESEVFEKTKEQIRKDNAIGIATASNQFVKYWRGITAGLDEITMFFKGLGAETKRKGESIEEYNKRMHPYLNSTEFKTGTVSAPRFADGGIVTRATMGLIGEAGQNEAVIPLNSSKGKDMLRLELGESSIQNLSKSISSMIGLILNKTKEGNTTINVDSSNNDIQLVDNTLKDLSNSIMAMKNENREFKINIDAQKINLSDDSINRLAKAIQKAEIKVNVNVDKSGNTKLSRDERELNYFKNSTSGLLDMA
jgi:hypothetical protein